MLLLLEVSLVSSMASLGAQLVKHLPAMQETWVQSLGWEDPLEKGMATHSSILAWKIPWTEEPGRLQSAGAERVGHDWATNTHVLSGYLTWVILQFVVLCRCSVAKSRPTLCYPMDCSAQASLSFTISQSLLKLMSVESLTPSNHLILCRPLLLPSIFPSLRVFSNESSLCIRWPKYWSFSFSISPLPMNNQSWFPSGWTGLFLFGVQGTFKSLHQWHNSKASIICGSSCFMVQPLHLYMTTGSFQPFIASSYLISYLSCINLLLNPRDINQAWFLSL